MGNAEVTSPIAVNGPHFSDSQTCGPTPSFVTRILRQITEFPVDRHDLGRHKSIVHRTLKCRVYEIVFNCCVQDFFQTRNSTAIENLSVMQEQPVALMAVDVEHMLIHQRPALQCFIEAEFETMQIFASLADFYNAVRSIGRVAEYSQEYAI